MTTTNILVTIIIAAVVITWRLASFHRVWQGIRSLRTVRTKQAPPPRPA